MNNEPQTRPPRILSGQDEKDHCDLGKLVSGLRYRFHGKGPMERLIFLTSPMLTITQ